LSNFLPVVVATDRPVAVFARRGGTDRGAVDRAHCAARARRMKARRRRRGRKPLILPTVTDRGVPARWLPLRVGQIRFRVAWGKFRIGFPWIEQRGAMVNSSTTATTNWAVPMFFVQLSPAGCPTFVAVESQRLAFPQPGWRLLRSSSSSRCCGSGVGGRPALTPRSPPPSWIGGFGLGIRAHHSFELIRVRVGRPSHLAALLFWAVPTSASCVPPSPRFRNAQQCSLDAHAGDWPALCTATERAHIRTSLTPP